MGFKFRHRPALSSSVRANATLLDGSNPYLTAATDFAESSVSAASAHGAISTLGLPGVGISFSTSLVKQKSAGEELQRQEKLRLQEAAVREEAATASDTSGAFTGVDKRSARLNHWRNEIFYLPTELYRQAVSPLPFKDDSTPPAKPNVKFEKMQFTFGILQQHLARQPVPWVFKLCIVAGSLFAGFIAFLMVGGFLGMLSGVLVAAATCPVAWLAVTAWWAQEFKASINRETELRWPEHLKALVTQYEHAVQTHKLETEEIHTQWQRSELQRTEFCQLLLDGDVESLNLALRDTLCDLNFPFDAICQCAVVSPDAAIINLEIPELNGLFPEIEHRSNARGELTQTRRPQYARYQDYAQLVAGLALWAAATAFSAAPTVKKVTLAAYTQRVSRGEKCDEYMLNVTFHRTMMRHIDAIRNGDPLVSLANAESQFELLQNGKFKTIDPPTW